MATRGRPKTDNIFRFNVATDLTDNKRFIRFKRCLGTDERTAYLTLVRFFNFVASNYALTGRISVNFRDDNSREDADVIADFCWWDGDPQLLISGLHESGFLEDDGTVHEWFENQPYASKKLRDRDFQSISETKISGNSRPIEGQIEGKEECIPSKASDAREIVRTVDKSISPSIPPMPSSAKAHSPSSQNGAKIPPEIVMLANDLLSTAHIADKQDRRDIAWDVYHSVKANREQDVHRLISEIKQGEHSEARNIVAVIRSKLRPEPG